jgi:hypothetical protein
MRAAADSVTHYASALRRRAAWLLFARAACAALGAGTLALTAGALAAGPVATPAFAGTAWTLVTLGALGALLVTARPLRGLAGTGVCRLLDPVAPELASRVRTALELRADQDTTASAALVEAHARGVAAALARVPRPRVAGWRWLRHRVVGLGLAAVALGVLALATKHARPGLHALLHPATVTADGLRIAPVVSEVRARLVFPAYLDRAPANWTDAAELAAPRGTSVELTLLPRLPSETGLLRLGSAELRLAPVAGGLGATFVVRDDAPIELRVESAGRWYADDRERRVRAIPDASPTLSLASPESDLRVRRDDAIAIRFSAEDDVGLSAVDLVTRLSGGNESRRRLWSAITEPQARRSLDQELTTTPAEEGAGDGDTLLLWLEAQDGDVVGGPKRAVSRTVSIEVIPRDRRAALEAPRLRELLDQGIEILGDRLEHALPEDTHAASRRHEALRAKTEPWLAGIEAFAAEVKGLRERDRVRGIVERTRRLLAREANAYHAGAGRAEQIAGDARVIEEHERDVLLLADLLGETLVEETRDLTNDLSQAAAEMRRLLDALRAAPSEAARRDLLAEIARAEQRLQELARSLSQMARRVPSDFVNREAVSRGGSRSALESLREAVESGDMEAALKHLDALANEFDRLTREIEDGGGRYRDSRFGPENAAFAEARQELDSLAAAQEQLAQRSGDMVRKLSERAGEAGGADDETLRALRSQAEAIERDLQRIPEGSRGMPADQSLDGARERARDTSDALRTGDLGEARRMAARAQANLEQLAPEMRREASMFPGHQGETARNAEAAESALSKLGDLQRQLEATAPDLNPLAGEGERAQMRGDAKAQSHLRSNAEQLERKFGGEPGAEPGSQPGGQGLSPSAARELREAGQRMSQARDALDRGHAEEASLAQEDASRRLRELGKQLDGQRRDGQGQGGGGTRPSQDSSEQEGGDGGRVEGPVRIPGADEFRGPERLRRRLLDAMREGSPPGFEQAVGRYYEELLR